MNIELEKMILLLKDAFEDYNETEHSKGASDLEKMRVRSRLFDFEEVLEDVFEMSEEEIEKLEDEWRTIQ